MNNRNRILLFMAAILLVTGFGACKHKKQPAKTEDSFMAGTADFLIDESLSPIIDEEEFVFGSLYTEAKPHMVYKSENQALNLLLNDSIRFAILARDLKPDEKKLMERRTLPATVNVFAHDAIALIVNQSSADTNITVSEVKNMLNGKSKSDLNIVFDNPNSSLVRYLKELSGSTELNAKNIYALKSNKEVVKYVSEHPKSIGIVGFAWLNDPDKDYAADVQKVRIMGVKDDTKNKDDNGFTKPSQESLALKTYPLSRDIYIINCTNKQGLGTGFEGFLLSDRGQRIVLKSGLLPAKMPGREINIVTQQPTQ
ncbi:substrate-binding domain-containing protein [Mucilaginibacter yixingensis]|nr:substrate-binding domain-containing protein [Mucilaginibacter yixingensis]